jgi:hypothetical protein
MSEVDRSSHPVDRLIRELMQIGQRVDQRKVELILNRMARAPFNPRAEPARTDELGLRCQGRTVQRRNESLFVHVVRRVVMDEQWAFGVTEAQYLDDLRRAIRDPSARLALYQRRGGHIAATLTPTANAVSLARRGSRARNWLWVVYSADRGIIVSGYQVSSRDELSIPRETRWLL